ncbi:MAG: DNA (cytosine-5-)-methyltransferase [Bacteroidota bacterium]
MTEKREYSVKVIDLFCGIGGLTHGLHKEGLNVVAGYDIDDLCEYPYEANNEAKFFAKDVVEIKGEELNEQFSDCDIKVLVGCAPCQPFSTYSFKSKDKAKWRLLYEYGRLIEETQPDIISMENVPRLAKFTKEPVFRDFLDLLKKNGYEKPFFRIVNCANYGVPQNRKRLVLLASKKGDITLIDPTHEDGNYETVKNAIGKLEPLESGEESQKDVLHKASRLSELNLKRIKQSKPGGTWKDWDEELRLKCHKKASGNTYVSVYGRMSWDKPSPTITTHCTGIGNGRFGHPEQDRAITLREAAILQSFPNKYKFVPKGESFNKRRMSIHIGNSVPPRLGQAIGSSIKKHIEEYYPNF